MAALALLVFGWAFVLDQHALLWKRLPADAAERFVPDRVRATLPKPLEPTALLLLCPSRRPSTVVASWRARQDAAVCVATAQHGRSALPEDALASAANVYAGALQDQVRAAHAWLAEHDAHRTAWQAQLAGELLRAKQTPRWTDPLLVVPEHIRRHLGVAAPATLRQSVGPTQASDLAASAIRQRLVLAESLLKSAESTRDFDTVARLGLAAAGLRLTTGYGHAPPRHALAADRHSLADALERQRRAQSLGASGFSLERLHGVVPAIAASAAVLVIAAAVTGAPLLALVLATQLLGAGAVLLTDVALTGDPALRHLATRQWLLLFDPFTVKDGAMTSAAHVALWSQHFWWPLLGVAALLLVLRLLPRADRGAVRAGTGWAQWGDGFWRASGQGLVLAAWAALPVLALGMTASAAEWLVMIGCVALATYGARYAALANAGGGLQWHGLAVVAGGVGGAAALSLWRGDLGHALVALTLGAVFLAVFGGLAWRAVVGLATAAAGVTLALVLLRPDAGGPLASLAMLLPAHAADRVAAMADPFTADTSDLARVHWLMDVAGRGGWGVGYVPWLGLDPAQTSAGLPLQGPSDYALALLLAAWGKGWGLVLFGLLVLAMLIGLVTSARPFLAPGVPAGWRLLAGLAFFGCLSALVRALLSAGGVMGVLPLTGLPTAVLGYGPANTVAALGYLGLASAVARALPPSRHAVLEVPGKPKARAGAREAAAALTAAMLMATAALVTVGSWRLARTTAGAQPVHEAAARLALARDLSNALATDARAAATPMSSPGSPSVVPPCPELAHAIEAWNDRLARDPTETRRLDTGLLLARRSVVDPRSCRNLARSVGSLLQADFGRITGRTTRPAAEGVRALAERSSSRVLEARDYRTANPWRLLPGCVDVADERTSTTKEAPCAAPGQVAIGALGLDEWLQFELGWRLSDAIRQPEAAAPVNHHPVPAGPALKLTLRPDLQRTAQRIADCYTARATGSQCDGVLPADEAVRSRHFRDGALRAGALGLVLVDVETGHIVALAGAVSACSVGAMQRRAAGADGGRVAALRTGERCARFPDERSAYLLSQHPALWLVGPGSSLKPLVALAGIESGQIAPRDDARWLRLLAESREQAPVQATALRAGDTFLRVLRDAGFAEAEPDLLLGTAPGAPSAAAWRVAAHAGAAALRPSPMPFEQMQRIRRERDAGVDIDRHHGRTVVLEYLAARRLADAAIGGGDLRISALGLADTWRRLDLASRGQTSISPLHLVELNGSPPPAVDLRLGSPAGARRALAMAAGVTSARVGGSARGACRAVFGDCAADGLPDLYGKTGTADFLLAEGTPWVKEGLQIPAKLFGGVFAAGGRRYAIAAMALRVREGRTDTLELASSAPAEAALTLVRHLRAGDTSGGPPTPSLP